MKMRIFVIIFVIGVFIACAKKETGIKNDVKLRIEEYKKIAINSYRKGNTENAINFLNQSLEIAYNVDSVENIIEILTLDKDLIAIEVNGEIVKKINYKNHILKEGDEIEILTLIGGG